MPINKNGQLNLLLYSHDVKIPQFHHLFFGVVYIGKLVDHLKRTRNSSKKNTPLTVERHHFHIRSHPRRIDFDLAVDVRFGRKRHACRGMIINSVGKKSLDLVKTKTETASPVRLDLRRKSDGGSTIGRLLYHKFRQIIEPKSFVSKVFSSISYKGERVIIIGLIL